MNLKRRENLTSGKLRFESTAKVLQAPANPNSKSYEKDGLYYYTLTAERYCWGELPMIFVKMRVNMYWSLYPTSGAISFMSRFVLFKYLQAHCIFR